MTLQPNLICRNTLDRRSWGLVKSKLSPCSGSAAMMQLNPTHKEGPLGFLNILNKCNHIYFKPIQKPNF